MAAIRSGDIIGFSGRGFVSAGINLATYASPTSGFSHVGIVCELHDRPLVYESTTFPRPPCVRLRRQVRGVQAHFLDDMLRWETARMWHVPLRRELYVHEERRLGNWLDHQVGTPYDMVGAGRSGGLVTRTLEALFRPEDLNSLFCSELVAAALVEIGVFKTKSVSKWSPNFLYRKLRRWGIVQSKVRIK